MINQALLYPPRRTLNWFKFLEEHFGKMNSSLKKIPVPGSDPKEITLGIKKKHHVQLLRVKISQKRKEGLRKQW